MNLNVNPLSFKAWYRIAEGKSDSKKTARNFDSVIAKLQHSRDLAVKSQQYMEKRSTKQKIDTLPPYDIVTFHNLRIYEETPNARELEYKAPHLVYTTSRENIIGLTEYTNDSDFDYFEFKLDKNGNLNEAEADEWLDSKISYFA